MPQPILDFNATMAALPTPKSDQGLDEAIKEVLRERYDVVIVLDDDPTGTQTVYDVPVITEWTKPAIAAELRRKSPLFFILTNSRALPVVEMADLLDTIGYNIRKVTDQLGLECLVIIRGDSTLRGHFPLEDTALVYAMGFEEAPHFLIPAFFEGGRYTIDDVHYVREGDQLTPAGLTPFAQDASFGYQSSNLKKWVAEKAGGRIQASNVRSLSIAALRQSTTEDFKAALTDLPPKAQYIVNAADYTDLQRAALAILKYTNCPFFRTSASFVKALLGQSDRPSLKLPILNKGRGGLIIVGSHVPKSTLQLEHLRSNHNLHECIIDVPSLLNNPTLATPEGFAAFTADLSRQIEAVILGGQAVLVYTSRKVVKGTNQSNSLRLALKVSAVLEDIVKRLSIAPAFLITKGGITSSRIATESLGVKRAVALGQVLPGVPIWKLGSESKFPGLPFVIFPGNVGEEDSLSQILQQKNA